MLNAKRSNDFAVCGMGMTDRSSLSKKRSRINRCVIPNASENLIAVSQQGSDNSTLSWVAITS
jgi:hypothetical protein